MASTGDEIVLTGDEKLEEEIKELQAMSDAELDKKLRELESKCSKRLQFLSNFLEDGIENLPHAIMFGPLSEHPRLLAAKEYLRWLESDTVCPTLKAWKALVVDDMKMRKQLMNGFTINEELASDTIDCLNRLCFQQRNRKAPSETDAWDATAFYAVKLVKDNDRKGSPIHGMARKGEVSWCFGVMIRLLIVVYSDMLRPKSNYFEQLLGGPKVKKLSKNEFDRDMLRINNKPLNKENELDGLHGYNRLHKDYVWFKDIPVLVEEEGE